MNTENDISERLLRLFPVASLRENFNLQPQNQRVLRETILRQHDRQQLLNFANNNLGVTKQHVYVHQIDSGRIGFNLNIINGTGPTFTGPLPNAWNYATYFIPLNVSIFETARQRMSSVTMLWPVTLQFNETRLYIKVTVMEQRLSYLDENVILVVNRQFSEQDLLSSIQDVLVQNNVWVSSVDLNRGIKHMWAADLIDGRYARYKKDRSVSTEVMNENFTIKRDMPDVYNDMTARPLEKNIFKFIGVYENLNLPTHFTVEPEAGMVAFTLYAPATDANDNVLSLILQNN